MAKHNSKQRKVKNTYLILVEGKTELWYLQKFKSFEEQKLSNVQIDIEPKLPTKKRLDLLLKEAKENSKSYLKVYVILDFDVILKEYSQAQDKNKTKLRILQDFLQKVQNQKPKKIEVLINNPCLEIWFLLHFEFTSKVFQNCEDTIIDLRRFLNGYEKTENFFIRKKTNIYQILKENLSKAISNAKLLGRFDSQDYEKTLAEMYVLFEDLEIKN